MNCEAADEANSSEPVLENLIVERNEQRPDVLCLSQVFIEALVQ